MSAERAREDYHTLALILWHHGHDTDWVPPCPLDHPVSLALDAASIRIDLAVSEDAKRRTVAWA